jgi:DNA-binding response OmpR family regulator
MESHCIAPSLCVPPPRKFGVLVVDDESAVRDVLNFGLRQKGFRVWRAAGGQEALKTYWRNRESIDAVLLDVRMPGLDGPQTLVKLRRMTSRLHCCFMSGDLGGYSEQTLRDLGALEIFRKPLMTIELADKLMAIVTDPKLNPSFLEARKTVIRRGPASESAAPKLTFMGAKRIKRTQMRLVADEQAVTDLSSKP